MHRMQWEPMSSTMEEDLVCHNPLGALSQLGRQATPPLMGVHQHGGAGPHVPDAATANVIPPGRGPNVQHPLGMGALPQLGGQGAPPIGGGVLPQGEGRQVLQPAPPAANGQPG